MDPATHEADVEPRPLPSGARVQRWTRSWDLWACLLWTIAAAFSVNFLPNGDIVRVILVLPVLFLIPGYVLLQCIVVPPATGDRRLLHAGLALGISPAIAGLLALVTALAPGGFRAESIVIAETVGCLLLVGLALRRRAVLARPGVHSEHQFGQTA